jgi:uncharacterized protein
VIVVSNTSPITNLAAIGQFGLLRELFGELHIAEAVVHELNAFDRRWPGSAEVEQSTWVKIHRPRDLPMIVALMSELDAGESETIALAMEMNADLVLMDEQAGRRLATERTLNVIGVLGVLMQAKQKRLIELVLPQVDSLRQNAGFYLSDQVYQRIGQLTGER